MEKIINTYYQGFEGEPEIQFVRELKNGQKVVLRIWVGYFDAIMAAMKPEKEGWTGLAYYYHLEEGWYEESPWLIPDLEAAISEFQKIENDNFDEVVNRVLLNIIHCLIEACKIKENVWICYE